MAGRERKAFWRFDRDETTRVSTERAARRQPVADSESPVRNTPGDGGALARKPRPVGSAGPNASRLRDAIDHGLGGDKVAFPDPAAAPLGTDDEAAGTTPTPTAVATAMRHELQPVTGPRELRDPDRGWRLGAVLSVIAGLACIVVTVAILS